MNGITRKLAPLVALAIFVLLLGAGPVLAAKKAKTPKPAALTINVKSGSKKLKLTRTQSIKVTLYCGTESKAFSGHSASAKFQLTPPCEFRAIAVVLDSNHAVAQGEVSATFTRKGSVDVNASALPQTGSITGVVRDSSGPLTGVAIATTSVSTTSGSDGRYWLSGLQPGSYTVTYDLAGYTPSQSTVTVTAGQETSANMFLAKPVTTGTVQGTVRLGASPVAGVTVTLDGVQTLTTATDGQFSFSGVEAGAHELQFTNDGTGICYGCLPSEKRNVFVNAGQTSQFTFTMTSQPMFTLAPTTGAGNAIPGPINAEGLSVDNINHVLYVADGYNSVRRLNPTTLGYLDPISARFQQPIGVAYSPVFQALFVLSGDGTYVWNNGTSATNIPGQPGFWRVGGYTLPDGTILAARESDVRIITPQGETVYPVTNPANNVQAICGDEHYYFFGFANGVHVIDAQSKEVKRTIELGYRPWQMTLVPGTNLLVVGDTEGLLHVYNRVELALDTTSTELQTVDLRDGVTYIAGLVAHKINGDTSELFVVTAGEQPCVLRRIRLQ